MTQKQTIILCGFTSCGKTTIGKMLAKTLSLPFYDTDLMLTENCNMTIREIFRKGGETMFRDLEHEIAKQVCDLGPSVVSTGGGMLTYDRNGTLLSDCGVIFYIDRPFNDCYANLSRQPDRPLFKNHTREELEDTYRERCGLYMKFTDHTIKNDGAPEDAVKKICEILETLPA